MTAMDAPLDSLWLFDDKIILCIEFTNKDVGKG
jgi:hypothetical protein